MCGIAGILYGEFSNCPGVWQDLQGLGYVFHAAYDTAVIVEAYRVWDTACFERFNGAWSLTLFDLRDGTPSRSKPVRRFWTTG